MTYRVIVLSLAAFTMLASVACQNSPGRPSRYSKVLPPDQLLDFTTLYAAELLGMPWAARQPGSGHSSCRSRISRRCRRRRDSPDRVQRSARDSNACLRTKRGRYVDG